MATRAGTHVTLTSCLAKHASVSSSVTMVTLSTKAGATEGQLSMPNSNNVQPRRTKYACLVEVTPFCFKPLFTDANVYAVGIIFSV